MKVIDLLNKIANNEEVPKRIKYGIGTWELDKDYDYHCGIGKEYYDDKLLCSGINDLVAFLNDEIEIIEEKPKKIEKLEIFNDTTFYNWFTVAEDRRKINEIIDYLLEKESDE